jgi:phage-related holin
MTFVSFKYFLAATWIWVCHLLVPVSHYIVFTMVLVLVDFASGVAAARHRGEPLRSRGFARTIQKISLYCGGILLAHGMDLVFFAPKGWSFDLVWIVSGFIALSEFKSNLENIATVTGVDIWSAIADRIPRLPKLPK